MYCIFFPVFLTCMFLLHFPITLHHLYHHYCRDIQIKRMWRREVNNIGRKSHPHPGKNETNSETGSEILIRIGSIGTGVAKSFLVTGRRTTMRSRPFIRPFLPLHPLVWSCIMATIGITIRLVMVVRKWSHLLFVWHALFIRLFILSVLAALNGFQLLFININYY